MSFQPGFYDPSRTELWRRLNEVIVFCVWQGPVTKHTSYMKFFPPSLPMDKPILKQKKMEVILTGFSKISQSLFICGVQFSNSLLALVTW